MPRGHTGVSLNLKLWLMTRVTNLWFKLVDVCLNNFYILRDLWVIKLLKVKIKFTFGFRVEKL